MTDPHSSSIYRHQFTVPESALDRNGHVNNVVYVQWMRDVAMLHSDSTGGTQAADAKAGNAAGEVAIATLRAEK